MGYIFVLVVGIVVLAAVIAAVMGLAGRKAKRGTIGPSVTVAEPAADEPTPGSSRISAGKAAAADQKTPPA